MNRIMRTIGHSLTYRHNNPYGRGNTRRCFYVQELSNLKVNWILDRL